MCQARQYVPLTHTHTHTRTCVYGSPSILRPPMEGEGIYLPTGPNHEISLTQITNRIVLSPKYCITRMWTVVFMLHSGHVENISRARLDIYSQSPITQFLQGPITMHGKCIFSMEQRKYGLVLQVVLKYRSLNTRMALWDQIKSSYNQAWFYMVK